MRQHGLPVNREYVLHTIARPLSPLTIVGVGLVASLLVVDVVSVALEIRQGVWMAEVPIEHEGISKTKCVIENWEFRHFTEFAGRFVNLLPVKDGATTLH